MIFQVQVFLGSEQSGPSIDHLFRSAPRVHYRYEHRRRAESWLGYGTRLSTPYILVHSISTLVDLRTRHLHAPYIAPESYMPYLLTVRCYLQRKHRLDSRDPSSCQCGSAQSLSTSSFTVGITFRDLVFRFSG